MKTTVRILALVLALVMLGAVLASCSSKPSGTYGSDNYSLTFSGSKVTVTMSLFGASTSFTGTFKMGKDGQGNKTITFDFSDEENASILSLFNGTSSYNHGKDDKGKFIEISGIKYYKK